MFTMTGIGRSLMIMGGILFGLGLFLTLMGRLPGLGKLPGDIVIQRGNFTFYFPVMTSILLSLVLSLLFWLLGRFR